MTHAKGTAFTFSNSFPNSVEAMDQAAAQRTIFDGSRNGFLLNCWHPYDMFQDTAATQPVTTIGQTVRRIGDASGNGLYALSNGTAHPTWQGSYLQMPAGSYLDVPFDLIDDKRTVIAALRPEGGDGRKTLIEAYDGTSTEEWAQLGLELSDDAGDTGYWRSYVDLGNPIIDPNLTTMGSDTVVTMRFDYIDDNTEAAGEIRVDGATVVSGNYNPTNINEIIADGARIFANRDASRKLNGRLYAIAYVQDYVNPTGLETWFAQRAGVVLT